MAAIIAVWEHIVIVCANAVISAAGWSVMAAIGDLSSAQSRKDSPASSPHPFSLAVMAVNKNHPIKGDGAEQTPSCSTIAMVTGAAHPVRKDLLDAKPPRVKSIVRAATFFLWIDHRIESQPILIIITTVGTGERPVFFPEQYLFTLMTSLHIFTSNSVVVVVPVEMHRYLRFSIRRGAGHPFRASFVLTAKIGPIQYIVFLCARINDIQYCCGVQFIFRG